MRNGFRGIFVMGGDFQLLDKITTSLGTNGVSSEKIRATKIGEVTQANLVLKENR